MAGRPLPVGTYRLQLREGLDLEAAGELLPYLVRLGVDTLYLSPVWSARPGSSHGYDVVDPREVDPALGGRAALERLLEKLARERLGLVLDFVPNHMAVHPANPFLADVLRHGPAASAAGLFDIDWEWVSAGEGHRPLALPFLDRPLPEALRAGALRVRLGPDGPGVEAAGALWPLDPCTLRGPLEAAAGAVRVGGAAAEALRRAAALAEATPRRGASSTAERRVRWRRGEAARRALREALGIRSAREAVARTLARISGEPRALAALLRRQPFVFCDWREAPRRIRYRRFFDVSELIAVRADESPWFRILHGGLLELAEHPAVRGVRIDHVDGLAAPGRYLGRLRRALARAGRTPPGIWVEKILAADEKLPPWPVEGTTGYEFIAGYEPLLVEGTGAGRLLRVWRKASGMRAGFHAVARRSKAEVARTILRPEADRVLRALRELAPELARPGLPRLLARWAAGIPRYRTYVADGARARREALDLLGWALDGAVASPAQARLAAALRRRLLRPAAEAGARGAAARRVLVRFEQLSSAVAAKGIEDTALYRYLPLPSLCEVGVEPVVPSPEEAQARFLGVARARWRRGAASLSAATTHDTKRSADARARLDAVTWRGDVWEQRLAAAVPALLRVAPPGVDAHGAWTVLMAYLAAAPPPGAPAAERRAFADRLAGYVRKSLREARIRTSWQRPDERYEESVLRLARVLAPPERRPAVPARGLRGQLGAWVAELAPAGLRARLVRLVLQCTFPGTPDLYRGDELPYLALVDPDNRRPVDFALRRGLLAEVGALPPRGAARRRALRKLAEDPSDPRIHLLLLRSLLTLRRRERGLFKGGGFAPVPVEAPGAPGRFHAWIRPTAERALVVVVDARPSAPPSDAEIAGSVRLPRRFDPRRLRCAFDGLAPEAPAACDRGGLRLRAALDPWPVGVWVTSPRPARAAAPSAGGPGFGPRSPARRAPAQRK